MSAFGIRILLRYYITVMLSLNLAFYLLKYFGYCQWLEFKLVWLENFFTHLNAKMMLIDLDSIFDVIIDSVCLW